MIGDLLDAVRRLRRQPGFAAVCTLTLALGIGACTTIFSVLNAVVLRPFPYSDAGALVYVWAPHRLLPGLPVNAIGPSQADFFSLQRDVRSFSAMAYFDTPVMNVASNGGTDRVPGAHVSPSFFATLGVSPLAGRTLTAGDDEGGRDGVVVISHRLWQRSFGGDAAVLGRTLTIDRRPRRVVGVMPPAFLYPRAEDLLPGEISGDGTDLWIPRVLTADDRASRDFSDNVTIARLAPRTTIEVAQAELSSLMASLDRTRSPEMQGWSVALRSLVDSSLGEARAQIWLLFGAVVLVLLIACSNAAHLLLTRAAERGREMSIRLALGAGRWRLVRQMLVEAVVVALAGGLGGVVIAGAAVRSLTSINPGNIPRLAETSVDARVLAFSLVVSLATAAMFGLAPALWASRTNVHDVFRRRRAGRIASRGRRLRQLLIVGESALAIILLTGAGLFLRSYAALGRVDTGFSRDAVIMPVFLDDRYATETAQRNLYRALVDRLGAASGIDVVGFVDALPLSHTERLSRFEVEGYSNQREQLVHARSATPGYFEAVGTPLNVGRTFADGDAIGRAPVVIVNQSFARQFFPGRSAVGGRFRFRNEEGSPPAAWSTIVGVVSDVRHSRLEERPLPQVYESLWQSSADHGYLVVKSALPVTTVIALARDTARAIDPALPLGRLGSMSDLVREAGARRRFQTSVLSAFAAIALVLSAIGLYGLLAYLVKQRLSEIGIRIAIGATPSDIIRLVVGQGVRLTVVGLAIGGGASVVLMRTVRAWLFETPVTDQVAFGGAAIALIGAALLACLLPARRALRTDVIAVLRAE